MNDRTGPARPCGRRQGRGAFQRFYVTQKYPIPVTKKYPSLYFVEDGTKTVCDPVAIPPIYVCQSYDTGPIPPCRRTGNRPHRPRLGRCA